ncbi:MAG: hypothetical protein IT381_26220 [Deltaproteobacteria bacterium]|nr:hypothetical protein [Deltaproteobacteria bacterium]
MQWGGEIRYGGQQWGNADSNHGKNFFAVGSDGGATGDWSTFDNFSNRVVPLKQWLCVEWHFDGTLMEQRFWIESAERTKLFASRTVHGGAKVDYVFPQFNELALGWMLYQGGTTPAGFDMWIDEVAIDDQRIGCAN